MLLKVQSRGNKSGELYDVRQEWIQTKKEEENARRNAGEYADILEHCRQDGELKGYVVRDREPKKEYIHNVGLKKAKEN